MHEAKNLDFTHAEDCFWEPNKATKFLADKSLHFKKLRKEEYIKPKQGRRKKIKSRNQQNTIRQTIKTINETKMWYFGGFPGGAVVRNPPANAGDTGSCPGPGRFHMPRSS